MTTTEGLLDSEELLRLALKAMEADKDDEALAFLKRAIPLAPENGRLYYLLGALHAEIGLVDRAIEEITRATELAPELCTARFQVGLLHLSTGAFDEAQQAWSPLDQLDEGDPLRIFKNGLVHLGNDEFEACLAELRRGLAVSEHESLNDDMRRIIESTESELAAAKAKPSPAAQRKPEPVSRPTAKRNQSDTQHVLLAGYRQQDGKKYDGRRGARRLRLKSEDFSFFACASDCAYVPCIEWLFDHPNGALEQAVPPLHGSSIQSVS